MPKVTNTHRHKREQLYKRITPEHIMNGTSLLSHLTDEQKQFFIEKYTNYFNSWIKDEAKEYILNEKQKR